MSKLFEDAIAEAKQLRELAEQNAKNAIVEAVTPRIREFIEEQLLAEDETVQYEESGEDDAADVLENVVDEIMSEMADDSDDAELEETAEEDGDLLTDADAEETEESYELDEDAMQMLSKMLNERSDLTPAEQKLKGIVLAMHKLKTQLPGMNESQRAEVQTIISQVKSHLLTNEGKMLENGMVEVDLNEEAAEVDSLTMEEIADGEDVEEALNELRLLLDLGDADEDGVFDMDAVAVSDADAEEDADADADTDADAEDEDAELDFELEDDEAPLDAAPEGEEMALDGEVSELDDEELEISEEALVAALREMKNTRVTADTTARTRNTNKTNESAQIATLNGKVAEYAKVVESLREQLTEMNLFNAKLLYVNKLVQDKNVTSEQRRGIVESLDGAKTLREVKLLYKGLTKSLKAANTSTKKGQISESAARRSIGSSSRPAGTQSTQKSHNENTDSTSNRWATLAGLK